MRAIGLWRRTSFAVGDGPEDRTTTVFWGQTSRRYIDVRVPVQRPCCEAGTLARLADRDVRALGQQQGFAGDLVCVGDRFFSEIPVIDIAALAGNDASAIAATARPIRIEPATNDLSAAASSPARGSAGTAWRVLPRHPVRPRSGSKTHTSERTTSVGADHNNGSEVTA